MLVARPIGSGVARYYMREGEPGTWIGAGCEALGLRGRVEAGDLTDVLCGRDPRDGRYLPQFHPPRRRAGWDLLLAAPKSLSLLAAGAGEAHAGAARGASSEAHRKAVAGVIEHLEHGLLTARGPAGSRQPVLGAVAAAFEHGRNAAGEPHLHTHVLLVNLGQSPGGVWGAVSGSDWWTCRRALGALYQMGLRAGYSSLGPEVEWRPRGDGLFELAGVPRVAVRAASSRSRAVAALGPHAARAQVERQATASGATGAPDEAGPRRPDAPRARVSATVAHLRSEPVLRYPDCARDVERRLASQRSVFRRADVLVALAACCPRGASAREAEEWATSFCASALPVELDADRRPRWTTRPAREADARFLDRARDLVGGERAGGTGADLLRDPSARLVVLSSEPGRSDLIAHARMLEECRPEWTRAGMRAAVDSRTPLGAARWGALTGLPAWRAHERADIVIVDHSDRRPTAELLLLVGTVSDRGGKLVLLQGGSAPRLTEPRSAGLVSAAELAGAVPPLPAADWAREGPAAGAAHEVARALVRAWTEALDRRRDSMLVGLGVDEVLALNRAARAALAQRGLLGDGQVCVRGRDFREGDRVVVLRGAPALGPRGRTGLVTRTGQRAGRVEPTGALEVTWDRGGGRQLLGRSELVRVGYAYAGTVDLARRLGAPLILFGSPRDAPDLRARLEAHRSVADSLLPVAARDRVPVRSAGVDLGL